MHYQLEYSTLKEDANKIIDYIKVLNDPETDKATRQEVSFRLGLRLLRIDLELGVVGHFAVEQQKLDDHDGKK